MQEVVEGSGVYWTATHRHCARSSASSASQLVSVMVDIFFDKKTLSVSNVKGGGEGKYTALDSTITGVIRGE